MCISQILKENYRNPIKILSLLYQAYPPEAAWTLVTNEDILMSLSLKQVRQELDLALKYYLVYTSDATGRSESRYLCDEVRKVLIQIREQLNKPKKF
jgi:hypothetical protein